jgi:uncharacterized membrane protein YfcA
MNPSLSTNFADLFALDPFDLTFVVSGVLFNLMIIGVYIAQKRERPKLVRTFGSVVICLAIPLLGVFVSYLLQGRAFWIVMYMGLILAYLVVELFLDFILKIEFRKKPILHVPYIILFYGACFGFIGISFSIDRTWGYIVSFTFWALLASLIYLYWGKKKEVKQKVEP